MIRLYQRPFAVICSFAAFVHAVRPNRYGRTLVEVTLEMYDTLKLAHYSHEQLRARLENGYKIGFVCATGGFRYECTRDQYLQSLCDINDEHKTEIKEWLLTYHPGGYQHFVDAARYDRLYATATRLAAKTAGGAIGGWTGTQIGGVIGGAIGLFAGNPSGGATIGASIGGLAAGIAGYAAVQHTFTEEHSLALVRAIRTGELSFTNLMDYWEIHMT